MNLLTLQAMSHELVKRADEEARNGPSPGNLALRGTALGAAATGLGTASTIASMKGIAKDSDEAGNLLRKKLEADSPVPIKDYKDFHIEPGSELAEKLNKKLGGGKTHKEIMDAVRPVIPAYMFNAEARAGGVAPAIFAGANTAPEIIAHELGHAQIDKSRLGRVLQNEHTRNLGTFAGRGQVGLLAGGASGMSDDERVRTLGRWAPLIAAAPQLAYEGGASALGLYNMRRKGATNDQMLQGVKMMAPSLGTYAMRPAASTALAHLSQAAVSKVRNLSNRNRAPAAEEKTAEEKKDSRASWAKDMAKTVAVNAIAPAIGLGVGMGGMHLADKLHEHMTGEKIPLKALKVAIPALTMMGGLAYDAHRRQLQKVIQDAGKDSSNPR